jgi:hypothetical protein
MSNLFQFENMPANLAEATQVFMDFFVIVVYHFGIITTCRH